MKGDRVKKWYRKGEFDGYQAAMKDIADKLESEGEEGVREWLKNNTIVRAK